MYCGRANDPKGTKQEFNKVDDIVPEGEEVDENCKTPDSTPVPYFDFAAIHEVGHAVDDAKSMMSGSLNLKAIAGWEAHTVDQIADVAATRFGFDKPYILATLSTKDSTPPTALPAKPSTVATDQEWEKKAKEAVAWCQAIREENGLWWKAGLSKQLAIGGKVYQEAYKNQWVSYNYAARSQGITGYQFRAPAEWFAELYAAYFSKKLNKNHPAVSWLKNLKSP
jgi:hypothetical protein